MTLEEVLDVMKQAEKDRKTVVRLHTGDPCVYGAVREQMDELDRMGIAYDSCPGVSSFCGAAADLDLEYTLPNISQSVIITRMAGRTPVPEKESIESFAAHQATMVIFLSTGMLEELSRRLIEGGYSADTPAAIVYKATWEDEKKFLCTVGTLAQTAKENQITKTALMIIGDVVQTSSMTGLCCIIRNSPRSFVRERRKHEKIRDDQFQPDRRGSVGEAGNLLEKTGDGRWKMSQKAPICRIPGRAPSKSGRGGAVRGL